MYNLNSINLWPLYRSTCVSLNPQLTRMWADVQRDGRPAEYRWRPLFNAAKYGWRPLLEYRAVTLPRCETRWNLHGCPKLTNWSQPLVGRSWPYCGHIWRRYCCLTSFFLIVDMCLSCEGIARQSCAMVHRWRFFASCIFSKPRAAHFRPASYFYTKATPCVQVWQTSNLQRLRLGEEKKKKKKPQGKNILSASATQGGHKKWRNLLELSFTAHVPLLTTTSAFELGKRC